MTKSTSLISVGYGGGGTSVGQQVITCPLLMCYNVYCVICEKYVKYTAVLSFVPNDGMECCGEMRF